MARQGTIGTKKPNRGGEARSTDVEGPTVSILLHFWQYFEPQFGVFVFS